MKTYPIAAVIIALVVGAYGYHVRTEMTRCSYGNSNSGNGDDFTNFLGSIRSGTADKGCKNSEQSEKQNAVTRVISKEEQLHISKEIMKNESIIASIGYLNKAENYIDVATRLSFIESMRDNFEIIESISKNITPLGKDMKKYYNNTNNGISTNLSDLRKITEHYNIKSDEQSYIKLVLQMKHNYITLKSKQAVNEINNNHKM